MPHIPEELQSTLLEHAQTLAACVQRDDTGDIIGTNFTGNGNGGNLSQETLLAKDALQRTLNDIKRLPAAKTED